MKHKTPCICETCEKAQYWTACEGCEKGHASFWKVVVESHEWKLWEKEVSRRENEHRKKQSKIWSGVWDVDECRGSGYISQKHFQDFLKFCKSL